MLRRAAAALGLAASVAGLPFLLVAAAGPPSLEGLPTWTWLRTGMHNQYLPLDPLLRALALLAWLVWLYLALTVALRSVAVIAARLHLAGSGALLVATELLTLPRLRHVVDAAIGMSMLASSVSHPHSGPAAHHAAPVPTVASQATIAAGPATWQRTRTLLDVAAPPAVFELAADQDGQDFVTPHPDPPAPRPVAAAAAAAHEGPQTPTYVVQPGDSLWRIAEHQLGDPLRWHELWQLNHDRHMPDGRVLRRPGLILPGWVLSLPPDVSVPPARVSPPAGPGAPPTPEQGAQNDGMPRPSHPETREHSPAPGQGEERGGEGSTRSPEDQDEPSPPSHVVELPSGAIVGLSLALAISTALAIARLRRRRRWKPAAPAPGISHTDSLVTDTIRRLEHAAHRAKTAGEPTDDADEDDRALGPPAVEPAPAATPPKVTPPPFGVVAIGHRDGQEIILDLPATRGLALTGPGASSAVRALVVTALATTPQLAVEIVVASADLAHTLLPDVATVPGLTIARDLDAALRHLEVELLYRTRLLDDSDVTTLREFTAINPTEPLPFFVLVAETPPPILTGRLAAVLDAGAQLGIAAVVLGDIPATPALTVNADGSVEVDSRELPDPLQPLTTARLFTLGPDQARETLELLAASRSEQPAPPPPLEDVVILPPIAPQPVSDSNGVQATVVEPSPAPDPAAPSAAESAAPQAPPIQVRALGPIRIEAGGSEIRAGLRGKARELLALLLLHRDGIAGEVAVETLWPGAPPPRGAERLQTVISNLRTTLKSAAGLEDRQRIVTYAGRRYTIDADLITCNLWRFDAALAAVTSATDPQTQVAALSQAVVAYSGSFAEGERFAWAEAPRGDLRQRALNAATRLAELHQHAGHLEAALTILEKAVTWDPQAEELYRRIMRLQATLDRPDAIQRTYDQLAARLDDLDEEPDGTTRQLLNELLSSIDHRT